MGRRGCLVKVLMGLLAIGLLLTVARGVGRFGWWQGYRMGQWSAQEEREEAPLHHPQGPRGLGVFGHRPHLGPWSALCGMGLLIKLGLVLLLMGLVSRLIGRHAWRPAYGPHPWRRRRPWHRHWYGPYYGPRRPRYPREERESFQAKVETDSTGQADEA